MSSHWQRRELPGKDRLDRRQFLARCKKCGFETTLSRFPARNDEARRCPLDGSRLTVLKSEQSRGTGGRAVRLSPSEAARRTAPPRAATEREEDSATSEHSEQ